MKLTIPFRGLRVTLRTTTAVALTLLLGAAAGACGPELVQVYDGSKLPDDQVTFLYNNSHLDVTVDRRSSVEGDQRKKLHKLELQAGHHAVEVRCHYSDDVPYTAKGGGPAPAPAAGGETYTLSPVIALTIDGDAGHAYKPRAHFERNAEGVPGCHVKMFDVTAESGGEKQDLY